MPMTTKFGRMVIYLEQLFSPLKSDSHIITWPCQITWQNKIIIYLLPHFLWLPNLADWGYTMKSFLPSSHKVF